jgi:dihydroxyacid dehydratase/phosphogluconate dehydratase
MGTASTMAIMAETMGLALPGSAVLESGDALQAPLAEEAGRRAAVRAGRWRVSRDQGVAGGFVRHELIF